MTRPAPKRKRAALSRANRLRVAELAIAWLGDDQEAAHFAEACISIERYVTLGGIAAAKRYAPKPRTADIVALKRVT